ncbi:hypothetical protein MRX96_005741 [Rhipicephalus microplus]
MEWQALLVLCAAHLLSAHADRDEDRKPVVCYYYGEAMSRPSPMNYRVSDIPGHLCNYVTLAFVTMNSETFEIESSMSAYLNNTGLYEEFTSIKKKYSHIKTLVSVGGWEYGHSMFSQMVSRSVNRRRFVKSAVRWMRRYGFDGLDISWQYPGTMVRGGSHADKENFVLVMKELKSEFEKYDFMLSTTIPIDPMLLKTGFNVAALSRYVDWFNVFTHDLRGTWTGYTDVHSPLRRRCFDRGAIRSSQRGSVTKSHRGARSVAVKAKTPPMSEDGLNRLVKLGAPKKKLMLGIPFYGRSYTLLDPQRHALAAPTRRDVPAVPGPYVMSDEILAYYEVCMDITMLSWRREYDQVGQCPYAYRGDQWVGYEDEESISAKVDFVLEQDYGGVMVFNIDMDDFNGVCGVKNPLLNSVCRKFNEGRLIDPRIG